jgi:hypothetical protein
MSGSTRRELYQLILCLGSGCPPHPCTRIVMGVCETKTCHLLPLTMSAVLDRSSDTCCQCTQVCAVMPGEWVFERCVRLSCAVFRTLPFFSCGVHDHDLN